MSPSQSTVVSAAIGVPAAIFIAWVLDAAFGVKMPAEAATALGALISTGVGYFAHGGQAADTVAK